MEKEKLLKQVSKKTPKQQQQKKQASKQTNMSGCDKHYKEGPNKKAESDGGSNFTKVRGIKEGAA